MAVSLLQRNDGRRKRKLRGKRQRKKMKKKQVVVVAMLQVLLQSELTCDSVHKVERSKAKEKESDALAAASTDHLTAHHHRPKFYFRK
jgi:hypothetical protein